jgi:tetratricopeptide (TPR) repeat protein
MNTVQREYILKGVFLGLWAYLALLLPDWGSFGRVVAWTGGGLAAGLLAGAVIQLLRGYRPAANPVGYVLLVLLDSSFVIYVGQILGLFIGLLVERPSTVDIEAAQAAAVGVAAAGVDNPVRDWLGYFVIGGAVLGFGFYQLANIRDWTWRFGLAAVVGAILVYLGIEYIGEITALATVEAQQRFAAYLLIGLPFFYVLTFCAEVEESEVEIAALCAGLGIGLYLLRLSSGLPEHGDKLIFLVPLLVYFIYVTRYLPHLRVFKHVLRGYGNLHLGKVRPALVSFGRALRLNPRSPLAVQGLWALHRKVDVTKLDAETVGLLNFDFCLDIAQQLLFKDSPPTETERAEARQMLDLVERHRPALLPRVDYLRAVLLTHAKQFDDAAGYLSRLLDPETPYRTDARWAVLFPAWDLALRLHPELVKRLGERELAKPGRRVEAIAAVERQLARHPDDPAAVELKRELYASLTEAEFVAAAATEPPAEFNYDYVEQLGLALVDEPDPAQVERGMAYLRIAGRGLPGRGPIIFTKLAELAGKRGEVEAARGYLEQVKRSGQLAGPRRLPADQRELYLAALKKLSDDAASRGDYQAAVDDYRLYVEAGKEDANSLRHLAELYAKNGDALNALLITERGLLYAKSDPDLLAKKDSYYYSVDPDRVRAVRDKVAGWFDVDYCVRKAQAVSNQKEVAADTLDWGLHLARLARVIRPESHAVQLVEARLLLRKGEREEAVRMLEDIREAKRGSGEEEDAWYVANRVLGLIYLDELNRPDLAINCFNDYREYQRSGADTLYDLGRAYEAKGDTAAAIKAYELVTAYQNHPRYWDATEAIRRLKGEG